MLKTVIGSIKTIFITSALFCLPIIVVAQNSKECPLSSADYARREYRVKEIRVDTPLQIFGQIKSKVAEIKADLAQPGNYSELEAQASPLREKEIFNAASWSYGAKIVQDKVGKYHPINGRVKFTIVFPHLRACLEKDTSLGNPQGEPTLVVEYKVYTTDYLNYLPLIDEGQGLSRAILPAPLTKFLSSNSPQPYIGFNRSRAIFGGTKFTARSDNALFNSVSIDVSGSTSSAQASLNLQGSRNFKSKALGHAEWLTNYSYSDIPSAPITLKKGGVAAQFIGVTQPLGKLKFILRYGVSVEGGNKQTDIAPGLVPQGILTSTGYGSLKFFAAGTFRKGAHDLTLSHGVELGGTGSDRHVDYIKRIFDLGYSLRLPRYSHKPVTLDTRFTAGDLNIRGPIPLGARFFGGNAEQNFISGDDWVIRSNPFIRSFAQNQFVPVGQSAPIGGDQFYSFNLTFAPTVRGRPLVPKEVTDSPDFAPQVTGAFNTVENATFASYLVDAAPVTAFAASLLKLDEATAGQTSPLNVLKTSLTQFEARFAGDANAMEIIANTKSAVDDTQLRLAELRTEVVNKGQVIAKIQRVAKDFSSCTDFGDAVPVVSSSLHMLTASIEDLMQLLNDKGVPDNDENRQKIKAQKELVAPLYRTSPCKYALLVATDVECSCQGNTDGQTRQALIDARTDAQQRAKEAIAPARELFDRLTNELNLAAISPLFMFDAARIRSSLSGLATTTTRYGIGGGIRLSIVILDIDLGYSFNPQRRPNEGRGAFVFSLRINNLLR